ncbi:hypothetical protein DL93DRAFT_2077787 [Clavulina sp. PMI_390]|nr:hypothetical protein DL93DRAFT_2077787 [Clavulina sp. PMI_390]
MLICGLCSFLATLPTVLAGYLPTITDISLLPLLLPLLMCDSNFRLYSSTIERERAHRLGVYSPVLYDQFL